MRSSILKGHLAALAAYLIWGSNIVFAKDITASAIFTPISLFTMRAAGAAILFWLISLIKEKEQVTGKDLLQMALASMIGIFLPQLTFLLALKMSTSIDTAIMSTFSPIFTMIFAAIFLKEPVTTKKVAGVLISFAGVIFLIFNSVRIGGGVDVTKPAGFILLLVNSLTFSAYLGIFRPLISRYSVITMMKWMFLFSFIYSLPLSAADLIHTDFASVPLNIVLEVGYLIVFATFFAYFLIPVAQQNIRPTLVSMYTYVQPMVAAALSIWMGVDRITWQKLLAAAFVIGGVMIVNNSKSKHGK